jgi:hypothetical protein
MFLCVEKINMLKKYLIASPNRWKNARCEMCGYHTYQIDTQSKMEEVILRSLLNRGILLLNSG